MQRRNKAAVVVFVRVWQNVAENKRMKIFIHSYRTLVQCTVLNRHLKSLFKRWTLTQCRIDSAWVFVSEECLLNDAGNLRLHLSEAVQKLEIFVLKAVIILLFWPVAYARKTSEVVRNHFLLVLDRLPEGRAVAVTGALPVRVEEGLAVQKKTNKYVSCPSLPPKAL